MKTDNVLEALKKRLLTLHKPKEEKKVGHVWQVWEDGEITLQKCGELLWQRNLHMISCGSVRGIPPYVMPSQMGIHGYISVANEQEAEFIALLLQETSELLNTL